MLKALGSLAFGLALIALPGPGPAAAQPMRPGLHSGEAACRRILPLARRFVGLPERRVRANFRPPPGVVMRFCLICTRDFRPNRLTFGLDRDGIVRHASCG